LEIQPIVIGTAGHIDHGKSTLERCLTGTDPDRLKEEKERGLTIDLGFARLELEDGRWVGLVDVPGHERFIKNMVAGATGMDLILLVVAADDGVMPQTREHLAIMEMLGIKRGLVALNKIDLVDPELAMLAEDDVRQAVQGTFLEGAPIVSVSGTSGEGLDELKALLLEMARDTEPRSDGGVFRMPVQRVFSARGFGTIVTGIPVSGSVAVGEVLEVMPSGQKGKVRGIQAYHEAAERARAGHSTALNLADVDHRRVERGDVVCQKGFFKPVTMIGASLRVLASLERPVANRMPVRLHTGTAEAVGEVVLLNQDEILPGETGLVQFRLEHPLVCAPGDRFVLRLTSPMLTLGGGVVLEESKFRLKRFKSFVIGELERQAQSLGSPSALLEAELARADERWVPLETLAFFLKRSAQETEGLLQELETRGRVLSPGPGQRWIHSDGFELSLQQVTDAITAWFDANSMRQKVDVLEVRKRTEFEAGFLAVLLEELERRGELVRETGGQIRMAGRTVELDDETAGMREQALALVTKAPFQPPNEEAIRAACGWTAEQARRILQLLTDEGEVQRVAADLHFSSAALEEVQSAIVANCEKNKKLEIPELRDALGTTRKFIIPLLEFFDAKGLTLRQAGHRVLKRR
jgi:selenocysteine-specific elongation factor